MSPELAAVEELVRSGELLAAVEDAVGPLRGSDAYLSAALSAGYSAWNRSRCSW